MGKSIVDLGIFFPIALKDLVHHLFRAKEGLARPLGSAKGIHGRILSALGPHLDPAGTKRIDDAQECIVGTRGENIHGRDIDAACIAGKAFDCVKKHGHVHFVVVFSVERCHEGRIADHRGF